MRRSLKELLDAIGLQKYPKAWDALYPVYMDMFEKEGPFFLDESYIKETEDDIHCLLSRLDYAIEAGKQVQKNSDLSAFAYLLYASMCDREMYDTYRAEIVLPETDDPALQFAFDAVSIFPLLPHLRKGCEKLRKRGLPEEIIYATMRNLEESILVFENRFERSGLNLTYFNWLLHYVDADILTIGRLQFEMKKSFAAFAKVYECNGEYTILMHDVMLHRSGYLLGAYGMEYSDGAYYASVTETDTYIEGYASLKTGFASHEKVRLSKSEWKLVLEKGDPVICVHIPGRTPLLQKACEESFHKAKEILATYYPDFCYKKFVCFSWLMDPQLLQYLKPTSNMALFQSCFSALPTKSQGKAVFTFLFQKPFHALEDLPEDTSLRRGVKQLYLNGGCIYELCGIFRS